MKILLLGLEKSGRAALWDTISTEIAPLAKLQQVAAEALFAADLDGFAAAVVSANRLGSQELSVISNIRGHQPDLPVILVAEPDIRVSAQQAVQVGLVTETVEPERRSIVDAIRHTIDSERDWEQSGLPRLHRVDESDNLFENIASLTSDYLYITEFDITGQVTYRWRSNSFFTTTGIDPELFNSLEPGKLVHPDDLWIHEERLIALFGGHERVDEFRLIDRGGETHWVRDYARPLWSADGLFLQRIVGAARDVTDERLAEQQQESQAAVLKLVASGNSLDEILAAIQQMVESQIPEARYLIQFSDPELQSSAGQTYTPVLDQLADAFIEESSSTDPALPIAEHSQSSQLFVSDDIRNDPRLAREREHLLHQEIEALWSLPILAPAGTVLGTLAVLFHERNQPAPHELRLLETAANLAGLAVEKHQKDIELRRAETRYRALVERTPAVTFVADPDDLRAIRYLSPQIRQLFPNVQNEAVEWSELLRSWVIDEDRRTVDDAIRRAVRSGRPLSERFRVRIPDGMIRWLWCEAGLVSDDGEPVHWQGVLIDVTERQEAIRLLTESEQRYRSLFERNLKAIFSMNLDGRVTAINPAAAGMTGYPASTLIDMSFLDLVHPDDVDRAGEMLSRALAGHAGQSELQLRSDDERTIVVSISFSPVLSEKSVVGISGIAEDVTEQRRIERELAHQAFHDSLTGLPNRLSFEQALTEELQTADYNNVTIAVLFMDLNGFKVINDSLGHDIGDQFLTILASRLVECVPSNGMVARLGGDEFTVLLTRIKDVDEARQVAHSIMERIDEPFRIGGYELDSSVSIGIAVRARGETLDPETLIRQADIALYEAKRERERNHAMIYQDSMQNAVRERVWIERDLPQAVERDQFVLDFLPVVRLSDNKIVMVEALLRWHHPEHGLMSPSRFVDIAEHAGRIAEIDQQMLSDACHKIANWNRTHPELEPLRLGANLSARELRQSGFLSSFKHIFRETGFDPAWLQLEISESMVMRDVVVVSEIVRALRETGMTFAIDDFGTGYSSLSYLGQLPLDAIKIDRSIIIGLGHDPSRERVARMITGIAATLNISAVAEGIEQRTQMHHALEIGCEYAQGFGIIPPGPFHELQLLFEQFLPDDGALVWRPD